MDRQNPTAGRENRQRSSSDIRTGEIFHSQQDLITAVFVTSNVTIMQVQIQR